MPSRSLLVEFTLATALAGLNAFACITVSVLGRAALEGFYGGHMLLLVPPATRAAASGAWWSPVLITLALIAFIVARLRRPGSVWPVWALAFILSAVTAVVAIGIVLPYATTTFRIGT